MSRSLLRRFAPRTHVWVVAVAMLLPPLPSASAEPVRFSVLSYNTHGLPSWIARDEPAKRFPRIARLAKSYDIGLLQENFVESDFLLVARELGGRFLERGNGSQHARARWLSAFCGSCGSGLTAAVDARHRASLLAREAYGSCSGWLGSANDCWASKGYLAVRLSLGSAGELDLYDLHLDAGTGEADHQVRRHQLEVLRDAVVRLSQGRAVIVAGDFNLNARVDRDRELLERFAVDLGVTRSAAAGGDRWPEHLDHILYRSGARTQLSELDAGEAREFTAEDGSPLSDHPAVFARFEATPR